MLPLAIIWRHFVSKDRPIFQQRMKAVNSAASNLAFMDNMTPNGINISIVSDEPTMTTAEAPSIIV